MVICILNIFRPMAVICAVNGTSPRKSALVVFFLRWNLDLHSPVTQTIINVINTVLQTNML